MNHKESFIKADIYIADMDRQYYCDHHLRLGRYPGETDEQLMLRLLTFVLFAHKELKFTPFQGTHQEAHLLQVNDLEEIENWIVIGQPSEKQLRRACQKSPHVAIVTENDKAGLQWWEKEQHRMAHFSNLDVVRIHGEHLQNLAAMCSRNMKLQINILDGEILVHDHNSVVMVRPEVLLRTHAVQAA